MFGNVRNATIRKSINIEALLRRIERPHLRLFGHLSRIPQEQFRSKVFNAKANEGKAS